uniref:Serpentine receptor class gamma n=1 Tax=Caenorhabditis tropicalis TaxID=1561998 RepID=A0A1I7T1N8_9PELO
MTALPVSRSIWNENPVGYFVFKRAYSVIITPLYPLAHYCVLRKSPKNFESLKWFLYFHVFCTTIEWFCAFFLIDLYDFEPSIVLRIDGVLKYFINPVLLYRMFSVVEDVSAISALFLFCNRLLIIVNMSRRHKSLLRKFIELCLYFLAIFFCIWSLPFTLSSVPDDQNNAKQIIMLTFQTEIFYPDCLLDPTSVVVSDPVNISENLTAEIEIASWLIIGLAIVIQELGRFGEKVSSRL